MKVKTSELTGQALDMAVSVITRPESACQELFRKVKTWPRYSRDWSQGGPIIERERMAIEPTSLGNWRADNAYSGYGSTPLEAAMRCFVASKLGDEVEIPSELI